MDFAKMIPELLFQFRFEIVVALASIIFFLLESEKATSIVLQTMLQAKILAKEAVLNGGKEQEDWVLRHVYKIFPKHIAVFFPERVLRPIIHLMYEELKDYLDDGEFNDSIRKNKKEEEDVEEEE